MALSHSGGLLILAIKFAIPMVLEVGVLRARSFLRPRLPDSSFLDTCFGFFGDSVLSLAFCAFLRTFFVWLIFRSCLYSRRILPFVCLTVGFVAGFARYRESIR